MTVRRPEGRGIGRVIEHLSDHLAADPSVARTIDLYQYRHYLGIYEKVLDRPPARRLFAIRDRCLPPDQQQLRVTIRDAVRQRLGEGLEQRLKHVLFGVRARHHLHLPRRLT